MTLHQGFIRAVGGACVALLVFHVLHAIGLQVIDPPGHWIVSVAGVLIWVSSEIDWIDWTD